MSKKKNDEVMNTQENMPDFLKNQTGRGSEEVDHNDLIIPRLEVVQSLSTVRKKSSSKYIEGAEEGMLYNSVTRELYGTEVVVVPILFIKEYLVWRDRKLGGGFDGAHPTEEEARAKVSEMDNPDEWEVVLTHQHFCLILKEDGTKEEAVVSMSKSKLKVSKKFNSLVRINGGDRFSRKYKLLGVPAENSQGQEFYNLDVKNVGFVDEPTYRHAEQVYDLLKSGAASADRSCETEEADTDADNAPF
jgi:hypothetical protein